MAEADRRTVVVTKATSGSRTMVTELAGNGWALVAAPRSGTR
jgi:hypothetical protein